MKKKKVPRYMTAYLEILAIANRQEADSGPKMKVVVVKPRGYDRCSCGSGRQFKNCCKK